MLFSSISNNVRSTNEPLIFHGVNHQRYFSVFIKCWIQQISPAWIELQITTGRVCTSARLDVQAPGDRHRPWARHAGDPFDVQEGAHAEGSGRATYTLLLSLATRLAASWLWLLQRFGLALLAVALLQLPAVILLWRCQLDLTLNWSDRQPPVCWYKPPDLAPSAL